MYIIKSIHAVLRSAQVDVSALIKTVDALETSGQIKRHGEKYTFRAGAKSASLSIVRGTRVVADGSNWRDIDFIAARFAAWHSLMQQAEHIGGISTLTGLPSALECLPKLFPENGEPGETTT